MSNENLAWGNQGTETRGKMTISSMFDDALKSVNNFSALAASKYLPMAQPVANPNAAALSQCQQFAQNRETGKFASGLGNEAGKCVKRKSQGRQRYEESSQSRQESERVKESRLQYIDVDNEVYPESSYSHSQFDAKEYDRPIRNEQYDAPIKGRYEDHIDFQPNCIKNIAPKPSYNNYDDVPIRSAQGSNYSKVQDPDEIPIKPMGSRQVDMYGEVKAKSKQNVVDNSGRKEGKRTNDEVPIKQTNKTFEELLEENLVSASNKGVTFARTPNLARPKKSVEKKPFLKRKSAAVKLQPGRKKFTYFADKFKPEEIKKEPSPLSRKDNRSKPSKREEPNIEGRDVRVSMAEFQKLEAECYKNHSHDKLEPEPGNKRNYINNEKKFNDGYNVSQDTEVKARLKVNFCYNLKKLSDEIEKLNKDRKKADKQKLEYEKLFKKFQEETVEFETYKEREIAHIGEIKEKEMKKFAQEKRVFDRQSKAIQSISGKKEKEEMEALKKETAKIQEDFKEKEGRYKALIDKAKRQLDDTLTKNKELEQLAKDLKREIGEMKEENAALKGGESPRSAFNADPASPKAPLDNFKNEIAENNCKDQEVSDIENEYGYNENCQESKEDEGDEEIPKDLDSESYDMVFPGKYHSKDIKLISQRVYNDGKIVKHYDNGKTELIFTNGVRKETFEDSYTVIYFNNRDVKQVHPDGKTVYYFSEAKTTQTTFPDGLQVFKFASGQLEKHYPDGTKEITFPEGTLKCIYVNGEEESVFPDGTVQRIEKNGVKAIEYPNGEREISFPDGTLIKEFPDGRVKKVHPDGTCENSYADRN
eukprot:TRINITY_DN11700_c0_g1_i4.p1 TRINITY_DN11700_c0_g1~~TRINITY_DN11700_c0_g1_i4.p1  ORF type:complete len:817 (-),score=241.19 TRINITY_DN11700_c0_g1_i4:125-2575(-)